jgi:hypothetical protein
VPLTLSEESSVPVAEAEQGMLRDLWFDVLMWKRGSALFQWLLGLALLILVGFLLRAADKEQRVEVAKGETTANACLAAAGSDLKLGESLNREMISSATKHCRSGKVSR